MGAETKAGCPNSTNMLMPMVTPTRNENLLVATYLPSPEGGVALSSKKQSTTALSTVEAEYVAAMHATKQVLWHCYLFEELGFAQPEKLVLWLDNQAAIAISHNPEFHARTKHIDITLHFLRDHVEGGTLELIHIPSRENLADIFTKGLSQQLHQDLTSKLSLLPVQGGVL